MSDNWFAVGKNEKINLDKVKRLKIEGKYIFTIYDDGEVIQYDINKVPSLKEFVGNGRTRIRVEEL